jgi:murein L,D-transpeptidase YafK
MEAKKKHTSAKRIGIILVAGAVLIAAGLRYQEALHDYLVPESPVDVRQIAVSLSKHISNPDATADVTKQINHALESKLKWERNPFGIPDPYNFNKESHGRYQEWIHETIEESRSKKGLAIIIDKAAYTLTLYENGKKITSFPVELGFNPIHDKFLEGDGCTPEGRYKVKKVKDKGQTSFYRAFLLDYPTLQDDTELLKLKAKGLAPLTATSGSLIEIHGNGSGKKGNRDGTNWTLGCIALSNGDMDRLLSSGVKENTPVTIVRYGTMEDYTRY